MPKPFIIKVKVPLVNESEVNRLADRGDAEILVANALKFYLEQKGEEFLDQGLDLDGGVEIETQASGFRDVDDVADI